MKKLILLCVLLLVLLTGSAVAGECPLTDAVGMEDFPAALAETAGRNSSSLSLSLLGEKNSPNPGEKVKIYRVQESGVILMSFYDSEGMVNSIMLMNEKAKGEAGISSFLSTALLTFRTVAAPEGEETAVATEALLAACKQGTGRFWSEHSQRYYHIVYVPHATAHMLNISAADE